MSSQSFSQLITVNLQYNGIEITKQCSDVNCVKSICIQGWSGPCLVTFCVTTGTCSANLHTQPRCGKSRTRKKLQTQALSTQRSSFVVHKLKFVFVSTLRVHFFGLEGCFLGVQ